MEYNETNEAYCVPGALDFQQAYVQLHGYVALAICVLGSAANSINIAVLSRREMASSTNSILTGLAVADLLVMLEYVPFALHMYVQIDSHLNRNTYGWAVFVYFHSIFSQTFHTISIWLTVTLAVWRYIAIAFPQRNRLWCDKKNTTVAIASAYAICPFLCLPIYFGMNIVPTEVTPTNNSEFAQAMMLPNHNRTVYIVQMSENEVLVKTIFWMYGVLLKLIPCLALSVLSSCLISKLSTTEKRRQKLMKAPATRIILDGEKARLQEEGVSASDKRASRTDRTTRMLLAVLGLFLLTEVPQGMFGLVSALAPRFFQNCYGMFGELMDVLALLSSAVNFVLYCSMSRQFRATFARLARESLAVPRARARKSPPTHEPLTQVTGPL